MSFFVFLSGKEAVEQLMKKNDREEDLRTTSKKMCMAKLEFMTIMNEQRKMQSSENACMRSTEEQGTLTIYY